MEHPGEEPELRRALRAAWDPEIRISWWQALPLLLVLASPTAPVPLRLFGVGLLLTMLVLKWRGSRSYPHEAPLCRATVERAAPGEVIVRLDDGALWGFHVEPGAAPRLTEGGEITLLGPLRGPVVAAVRRPGGGYQGFPGRRCRLYRPAPSGFVTPVPTLSGGQHTALSREQAEIFLAHRIATARGRRGRLAPWRRRVLVDIGTEPSLEDVEVLDAPAGIRGRRGRRDGAVRVRRRDGQVLSWPVRQRAWLLSRGARVWATRPETGLYVVLVLTTDEGRRAEDIWPAKPASADAEAAEAGQAAAPG